jgi:hypothetical protein
MDSDVGLQRRVAKRGDREALLSILEQQEHPAAMYLNTEDGTCDHYHIYCIGSTHWQALAWKHYRVQENFGSFEEAKSWLIAMILTGH